MTPTQSNELLPCPFCNSKDVKVVSTPLRDVALCLKCEALGPASGDKQMALIHWNRRASAWVKVGERLPKNGGVYLLTDGKSVWENHYYADQKYFTHPDGRMASHWQPLPKPPKE